MRRTRTLAAVLTAAALTATAACGQPNPDRPDQTSGKAHSATTSPSPTPAAKLAGGATGWGIYRTTGGQPDNLWATTLVTNHTATIALVNVAFAAYDQAGTVVGTGRDTQALAKAGTTVASGTTIDIPHGTKVTKVVATVAQPSGAAPPADNQPGAKFTAAGVHVQEEYGEYQVLGEVHSTYQQTIQQVAVGVICYDQTQHIVGGGEATVDSIGGGQTVAFTTDTLIVTSKPARCDAYPTMTVLSAS